MRITVLLSLVLVFALSACGGAAAPAETAVPATVVAVPTETLVPVPTETTPTETPVYVEGTAPEGSLSTEWHVCGFVKEGEGIHQMLTRVGQSYSHDMGGNIGQQIEIVYMGDPNLVSDDWLAVYDWDSLNNEQPIVYVGDYACDTLYPRMQNYFNLLPENDHRGDHSH